MLVVKFLHWQDVGQDVVASVKVAVVVIQIVMDVKVVVEPAVTAVPAVKVVVKDVKVAAINVQVHAQGVPTVQQFVKAGIEVAVENVMVRVVQIVHIAMVIVDIVAQVSVRPAVKVHAEEIVTNLVLETVKANAQMTVQAVQAIVRANAKVVEVVAKKIVQALVKEAAHHVEDNVSAAV